jgi:HK97 family phage prohead protease
MNTLYRSLEFESCKVAEDAERSIDVIASTAALDSHGEIVKQDWDLTRYLKNPVVLWNHNRCGDSPQDFLPIGKASNVRVEGGKLKERITFASAAANPLAEQVWLLATEGVLKGVSVGFRPGEITTKIADGKEVYVLSKCELRETSMVPIGSNPEAVAKGIEQEHKTMAIFLAANVEKGQGNTPMKTVEELQEELNGVSKSLADERSKIKELESSLVAEKAASSKLEAELKVERERSSKAHEAIAKSELDLRVGVKFLPAEREELDALVKDIGIERTCKILDLRANVALTKSVEVDGEPVATQPATEKSLATGASAQIASEAAKKAGL